MDNGGKTIDEELEKKIFEAAGDILANLWDGMEIDGYKVHAELVEKEVDEEVKQHKPSAVFRSRHVLETQYMTVYLKCDDRSCCSPPQTKVDIFFANRRIPALIPTQLSPSGPVALELEKEVFKKNVTFPNIFARIVLEKELAPENLKTKYNGNIPYDVYFPTLQHVVDSRTCAVCGKYHATKKSLNLHRRTCTSTKAKRKRIQSVTELFNSQEVTSSSRSKRKRIEVNYIEDDSGVMIDDDEILDDTALSDDDLNESEVEEDLVEEPGVLVSVPTGGTFERILNLKELAWTED